MTSLVLLSCIVFVLARLRWRVPEALRGPPPAARERGTEASEGERARRRPVDDPAQRRRMPGRPGRATMRAWRPGA
jgi:hypothetical protein